MIPDWAGWLALVLGAVGAAGVLFLVVEALIDLVPRLSFKIEVAGVHAPLRGNFGGVPKRVVAFTFKVWNRTSRPQRLRCGLAILDQKGVGFRSYSSWARLDVWDFSSQGPIDPRDFEVPARDGRWIAIQGELRPETAAPGTLEFSVSDGRLGSRHWTFTGEFELPSFPLAQEFSERAF